MLQRPAICEQDSSVLRLVKSVRRRRYGIALLLVATVASQSSAQLMAPAGKLDVSPGGAATYSLPIAVPPGTAGVRPTLTLEYSSQSQNGILGVGWSLGGLPTMTRCPRTMIQNGVVGRLNFDGNDRFCLNGQQITAISGSYGADGTEYRTEVETFNRIISRGTAGTGPAWFEVRTKDGQILQFGNTSDSRPLTAGGTARSWVLNKLSDTKGNYFTVTYTNDVPNGQIYPTRIDYTGNAAAGLAPYNSVQFEYATRPDIVPTYHAGALTKTTVRLTNVKTYNGAALVSDYRLAYDVSVMTGRSRLTSIALCAPDNSCLPSTSFTWQNGSPGNLASAAAFNLTGVNLAHSNGLAGYALGDFNGDGKTDILRWSDNPALHLLFLSNGDGSFTTASAFNLLSEYLQHSNGTVGIALGDFNGDGKTDILRWWNATAQNELFLSNGDGSFTAAPAFNLHGVELSPQPRGLGFEFALGDFNGDGKTDILRWSDTPAQNVLYLSNGDGSFTAAPAFNLTGEYLSHSNRTVGFWLGDFNGDGLTDILRWWDVPANNEVFLSNGDGSFTAAPAFNLHGEYLSHSNSTVGFALGDFNGDGKTDILRWWNTTAQNELFLSNGDGSFTAAPAFNLHGVQLSPIPKGSGFGFALGDFNGDSKTDILRWSDTPAQNLLYLSNGDGSFTTASAFNLLSEYLQHSNRTVGFALGDFDGNGKADVLRWWDVVANNRLFMPEYTLPDLLVSYSTGLGVSTQITYKPLTNSSAYTKETNATYPVVDMIGAVQVVSRVDTANGIGGTYSTSYSYVGAKADARGRFLGFRQVRVQDLQTNIVQTANYRQDFPYIGMPESVTKVLGATTLNQGTTTYQFSNASGAASVSAPSITSAPYRVSVAQTVAASKDLDGTVMPTVTTTNQFDAFGNATQVVVSTPDGYSKTTTNTYSNDTTNWFLGRLTGASVISQAPAPPSSPPPLPPAPAADLTISKSHSGNFAQGQVGATYSITVTNVGSVPTKGTVTVTDTVPSGLTPTAMSGTGWSCTLATRSCTRSDALAPQASYPAITLTVSVVPYAPASVTNVASVSGGGETNTSNNTASDITTITQAVPGSQNFTSPGTYSFTVPLHNSLTVQLWGAGGAGQTSSSCGWRGNTPPENGTASSFNGTVIAGGGGGGSGGFDEAYPAASGGTGGIASGGDTNINGSVGDAGGMRREGGPGGNAPAGGGAGGASGGSGASGSAPGGGGGGGGFSYAGDENWWGTWPAGGSGAYSQKTYSAGGLNPGTSVTVVVGSGGPLGDACNEGGSYSGRGGPGAAGRVYVSWN